MSRAKRVLIWLKRFRYRCGYGVHSPFAFDFITNVVYEKSAYYAYSEIESEAREGEKKKCNKEHELLRKVNRFLFRSVNRVQPDLLLTVGGTPKTLQYLLLAKKTARHILITSSLPRNLFLPCKGEVTQTTVFLFIDRSDDPQLVETILEESITKVSRQSVIVIHGIYQSPAMKALWKKAVDDARVGVTFDLYHLGVLFFDHSKIKQHYIVNF